MDSSNPTMFYCKQCKTMLNEKCFLDSDTGNLNSICSMCALILKSTGTLGFTHSVEERRQWNGTRTGEGCRKCTRTGVLRRMHSRFSAGVGSQRLFSILCIPHIRFNLMAATCTLPN